MYWYPEEDVQGGLFEAARDGDAKVVRALIKAGADVNEADAYGETPLFQAAKEGHEAVVKALIEAGADVAKGASDGTTPVCAATRCGHELAVKALIECYFASSTEGLYPGPVRVLYPAVVEALAKAGADVSKVGEKCFRWGGFDRWTPLYAAVMVLAMTSREAAYFDDAQRAVVALIEAGADVHKGTDEGMTPLHLAARNGFEAVVRALIGAGADVNQANRHGSSPLWFANGHESTARALRNAGAARSPDDELYDVLMKRTEDATRVRELADAGANVNLLRYGCTPLCMAAEYGCEAVVRALIEAGADVEKKDEQDGGMTPLSLAVGRSHVAVVKALIEAGADVNRVDDEDHGISLMDCATSAAVFDALIAAGARVGSEYEGSEYEGSEDEVPIV